MFLFCPYGTFHFKKIAMTFQSKSVCVCAQCGKCRAFQPKSTIPRKVQRRHQQPAATKRATGPSPEPQCHACHAKSTVDVAKCHACHAKRCGITGDQRRPNKPPDPAQSATGPSPARHWPQPSACDKVVCDEVVCDKVVCERLCVCE